MGLLEGELWGGPFDALRAPIVRRVSLKAISLVQRGAYLSSVLLLQMNWMSAADEEHGGCRRDNVT